MMLSTNDIKKLENNFLCIRWKQGNEIVHQILLDDEYSFMIFNKENYILIKEYDCTTETYLSEIQVTSINEVFEYIKNWHKPKIIDDCNGIPWN